MCIILFTTSSIVAIAKSLMVLFKVNCCLHCIVLKAIMFLLLIYNSFVGELKICCTSECTFKSSVCSHYNDVMVLNKGAMLEYCLCLVLTNDANRHVK